LPTLAGFLAFVRNLGIPTAALPDDSFWLTIAFNVAVAVANQAQAAVPVGMDGTTVYTLMVYNLATDNLVNFAQDVPGAPNFLDPNGFLPDDPPLPFFAGMRKQWGINNFAAGVVASTSDVSTSTSLEIPEQFKQFTIANLRNLKTPWGRQYLEFAQDYGTLWGLS
jgi:hypothetical protein